MTGVGGGGRINLSCAPGPPMDDGTPLAPVGNGRPRDAGPYSKDGQGHTAGDHGPGAAAADSHTKREKQWPHFGKSATRSAKGSRSVHRRKEPQHNISKIELQLRCHDNTRLLKYMEMVHGNTSLENR